MTPISVAAAAAAAESLPGPATAQHGLERPGDSETEKKRDEGREEGRGTDSEIFRRVKNKRQGMK